MCYFKKQDLRRTRSFFERYLQIADTTRPDYSIAQRVLEEIERRLQ